MTQISHGMLYEKGKYKIGDRVGLGGGEDEYNLETNSCIGSGVLGDSPPPSSTPPRFQHTSIASVARDPNSDLSVLPLRPRSSRATAGNDFITTMKIHMIQDREERNEDRRLKNESMREARREEHLRREKRSEDRQNTERMFVMALGGMANYFSAYKKTEDNKGDNRKRLFNG